MIVLWEVDKDNQIIGTHGIFELEEDMKKAALVLLSMGLLIKAGDVTPVSTLEYVPPSVVVKREVLPLIGLK